MSEGELIEQICRVALHEYRHSEAKKRRERVDFYLDELVVKPPFTLPYFSELQKTIARRLNIPITNVTIREKS